MLYCLKINSIYAQDILHFTCPSVVMSHKSNVYSVFVSQDLVCLHPAHVCVASHPYNEQRKQTWKKAVLSCDITT